jgi:DNA-directed RNA polymerase specialized sigma24 family protein
VQLNAADPASATRTDFCRIFRDDMKSLYLLALVLTADHEKAEQCFVAGLADSVEGNAVFKEWAASWARRTITEKAIRMVRPRSSESGVSSRNADHATKPAEIAAIEEVPAFERFAFVMSVLEHYSDRECSLLLNCTRVR